MKLDKHFLTVVIGYSGLDHKFSTSWPSFLPLCHTALSTSSKGDKHFKYQNMVGREYHASLSTLFHPHVEILL